MRLNNLKADPGSRKTKIRLGRGIGSGMGKTAGRGHKGQRARAGGYHKVGFEGGQMPLQRRVPKFGFTSRIALTTKEVRLHELNKVSADIVDLHSLREAGVINGAVRQVKIFLSGELTKPVTVRGCGVTQGARAAIEKLGGHIES